MRSLAAEATLHSPVSRRIRSATRRAFFVLLSPPRTDYRYFSLFLHERFENIHTSTIEYSKNSLRLDVSLLNEAALSRLGPDSRPVIALSSNLQLRDFLSVFHDRGLAQIWRYRILYG